MNFKIANNFNVYVLNDHKQSNTDSEGRVAVGGNATYSNYGIGSKLTTSLTRADLIVNGTMDITGGTNFNGNSVIGNLANVINYTMTNNNGVVPQLMEDVQFDFEEQNNYLRCSSINWALLEANGTAKVEFGGLTLTGTDPTLNIFNINGDNIAGSGLSLAMLNKVDIVAPIGSTILINVSGNSLGFGSYGMFRNGLTATGADGQYILWNLFEALSILPGTTSVKGSLLAPLATYNSGFTNIEGTIMVDNLYGNIEAHYYPFIGNLPDVCSITSTTDSTTTESTTTDSTTTDSTTTDSTTTDSTTTDSTTTESTTTDSTTTESTTTDSTTTDSTTTDSTTTDSTTTDSTTTDSTTTDSTTTNSTTTETTTTTTSTISTTTAVPCVYNTSVNNIIESVAEEQSALASLIEAESQKIVFATENCSDCKELICINKSAEDMIQSITNLEVVLSNKLKISKKYCNNICE